MDCLSSGDHIVSIVALLLIALQALIPQTVIVSIDSSGIVNVSMDIDLVEGVNEIKLPIEPIVESIEVRIDNQSIVPIYSDGMLYVFALSNGSAHISYLANISIDEGVFRFAIESRSLIKLVLSNNVILLTVPENLVNFSYVNDKFVLYIYGPQTIEYIVKQIPTTTPTTITQITNTITETETKTQTTTTIIETKTETEVRISQSPTPTPSTTPLKTVTTPATQPKTATQPLQTYTITSTPTTTTSIPISTTPISTTQTTPYHITSPTTLSMTSTPISTSPMGGGALPWYTVLAIAIVIICLSALLLRRFTKHSSEHSSEGSESEYLSDLDRAILNKLAEKGGSALQSELQKELGVPKTTLWRHIRKLERLGFVDVVKEGPFNRVILKKKP